jgi:hypothetical protein
MNRLTCRLGFANEDEWMNCDEIASSPQMDEFVTHLDTLWGTLYGGEQDAPIDCSLYLPDNPDRRRSRTHSTEDIRA